MKLNANISSLLSLFFSRLFFSFMLLLLILSTAYDLAMRRKNREFSVEVKIIL